MFYEKVPELLKDLLRRTSERNSALLHLNKLGVADSKVTLRMGDTYLHVDAKEFVKALEATNENDKPAIEKLKEADTLLSKIAKSLQ